MDLPYFHYQKDFNMNTFWNKISGDQRYDASNSKGTVIGNPCIRVAQRLLAYGLFARDDSLNVCLSELYFLYSMLQGGRLDLGLFLVSRLNSVATSSTQMIMIQGLITPIARLIAILLNPNDRVPGFKWLNLAAFEQMYFCKVEDGRVYYIYPGNCLMPPLMLTKPLS